MHKAWLLSAVVSWYLVGIVPAGAAPPVYEEVPFGDGAVCDFDFDGEEEFYGTPGYPEQETETVLMRYRDFEDGRGRIHQSVEIVFDGVQYDYRNGDAAGPDTFLASGTLKGHGWYLEEDGEIVAAFGSIVWSWTLTDSDGESIGTSHGNIVDFGFEEGDPRLIDNSHGVCLEP